MPIVLPHTATGGGRPPIGVTFASSSFSEEDGDCTGEARRGLKLAKTFVEEAPADPEWDPTRQQLGDFFHNPKFEMTLAGLLLFNVLLVWIEIDSEAGRPANEQQPDGAPAWVITLNVLLLVVYVAEIVGKLYVYRLSFFTSAFSVVELLIVVLDVCMSVAGAVTGGNLPSMSVFRIFRLLRLARAARVLVLFPELDLMIKGLKGAMNAIFWGCLLVAVVLFSWSIIFVQVVHPLNLEVAKSGAYDDCSRCVHAYESVLLAFLTFTQQIVAGDSWGSVTVPIIEQYPWTYVLFLGVLVTVSFAIMNLILAVIVDAAQEARKLSDYQVALERDKAADAAKQSLMKVCEEIDADKGGTLCLQELLDGFDSQPEFQKSFKVLNIGKEDMTVIFSILDADNSGDVDYHEFVNELHRMKSHDIHTMLVFIKHYVTELDQKVARVIKTAEDHILERMHVQAVQQADTKGSDKLGAPSSVSWRDIAPQGLAASQNQKLKDGSAPLESKDDLPEMRQAHDELVTAMQGILEGFGSMLRQQQAALQAPAVAHPLVLDALTLGNSRGALHFGTLPGVPPPGLSSRDTGDAAAAARSPRLPAAAAGAGFAVVDGVEVALPPWPKESRPKAPGCCAYAGAKDK